MYIVSSYQTPVTREMLARETGHRRNTILRLAAEYPEATRISIAERGRGGSIRPADDEVVYVMATGGRWGRSAEVRVGALVRARARERLDAAIETSPEEKLAPYRSVLDELDAEQCYDVSYDDIYPGGRVLVWERLHDYVFAYPVESPEALRAHILHSRSED